MRRSCPLPTIADLDADGSPEILVGTDSGRLYIYDGATMGKTGFLDVSMRLAELRLQEETQQIRAAAAVGNVGGGPSPEVVLATRQGKVIAVEASTLNILWYYEFGPSKRALPQRHSAPVLCDLDGDQSLEVVVTSNTGDVCALKSPESGKRAEKLWSYSTGEANRLVATPALVDFDKDGFFDVVAAGEDGRVFLIDGRPQVENRLLWSSEEGVAITASPVIGDVDGNGYLDILCLNDQGRVTIYETNSRTFRHTIGSAMLYHLPSHINSYSYDRLEAGPYRARLMAALTVLFLTVSGVLMLWVRRKRKIEA